MLLILVLQALVSTILVQAQDKYTDENRPYKFGFNIQGYQHRHEEKDEKGIIMGEYGFITADGYYRVTVYATDENGDFKILKMKNIYVGFPPEDPSTTHAPERGRNLVTPIKFSASPRSSPQATPLRKKEFNSPISKSTISTTPPTTTPSSIGRIGCSNCKVIPRTTTQRPTRNPQKTRPIFRQNQPFIEDDEEIDVTTPRQSIIEKNRRPSFDQNSIGFGKIDSSTRQPIFGPNTSRFNENVQSVGRIQSTIQPNVRRPSVRIVDKTSTTQPIYDQNYRSPQDNDLPKIGKLQIRDQKLLPRNQLISTERNVFSNEKQPKTFNPSTENVKKAGYNNYVQQIPKKTSVYPDITTIQPEDQTKVTANYNSSPYVKESRKSVYSNERTTTRTTENYPRNVQPRTNFNSTQDRKSTYRTEQDGLPPGINENDIKDLLYKFNYTVGFHGHHEEGYRNGDKKGDYFFDARDAVERKVDYIANEFGYQPNITLVNLKENDERIPKEDTEKDFGLKGYEFKWYPAR